MAQSGATYTEPVIQTEEASESSKRLKLIIVATVLVGALLYFAFMAFQSATVYYYTPTEIMQQGPTPDGKLVRVSGKLVPASFERESGSTVATFALTDDIESVPATHNGVLPDLFFNDYSEIILEGTYSPEGVFESQNVIVKCPSKYVGEEEVPESEEFLKATTSG